MSTSTRPVAPDPGAPHPPSPHGDAPHAAPPHGGTASGHVNGAPLNPSAAVETVRAGLHTAGVIADAAATSVGHYLEGTRPGHGGAAPVRAAEPRWPALLAVGAVALLYYALPGSLTIGPPWLLPTVVLALLVPTVVTHRLRRHDLNQQFGFAMLAVMTTALVAGLVRLVQALPTKAETPETLLRSAAALWLANLLVFASWYWRVDAGGPHARAAADPQGVGWRGAFLFPQQTMSADDAGGAHAMHWRPQFVDYLFLAFNASTAFSPTDAPVLSRWAKLLMMLQSMISLATLALLAARAVNIL